MLVATPPKTSKRPRLLPSSLPRHCCKNPKAINGAIKQLVYDQILFQDLDLIATPTDYSSGASVSSSSGGGGTDGGRSGGGGNSGKFTGGSGMGMGMGAGMGAGAGGFGGNDEVATSDILELPVYQLNIFPATN